MEIKGFDGNLSEESKKALQSETWQKVSFKGTEWKEEKELGFAERGGEHEQVEDRVV